MGLEKLAKLVAWLLLFIGFLLLPVVQSFLGATYRLITQFNDGFLSLMPGWFIFIIVAFIVAGIILLINSQKD